MKRPGSAEGNGLFANLGSSSKSSGGPAVLKPLAPPPSHTPSQVSTAHADSLQASDQQSMALLASLLGLMAIYQQLGVTY